MPCRSATASLVLQWYYSTIGCDPASFGDDFVTICGHVFTKTPSLAGGVFFVPTIDSITQNQTNVNHKLNINTVIDCLRVYAARYQAAAWSVTSSPLVPLNRSYYLTTANRCRAWAAALKRDHSLLQLLTGGGAVAGRSHRRVWCGHHVLILPDCDPPGEVKR